MELLKGQKEKLKMDQLTIEDNSDVIYFSLNELYMWLIKDNIV